MDNLVHIPLTTEHLRHSFARQCSATYEVCKECVVAEAFTAAVLDEYRVEVYTTTAEIYHREHGSAFVFTMSQTAQQYIQQFDARWRALPATVLIESIPLEYLKPEYRTAQVCAVRNFGPLRESLSEAGYLYYCALGDGEHVLRRADDNQLELWFENPNHASYGIVYNGIDLEFAREWKHES